MAGVPFWLKLLLSVLTLRHSDAVHYQCSELQYEISGLERKIVKGITELKNMKDIEEQLKTETRVSETTFRPLKLEEYDFKCKLQPSDGVISNVKKQQEGEDGVLQSNNKQLVQLQTTIDGLTDTAQSLNQTARGLCEKHKQMQTTIDGLTKTEGANTRTVQELLEKQKQMQTTIDSLTKTVESLNQTVQMLCRKPNDACRYLLEAAESGDVNTVKILFKCTKDNCTTDNEYRDTRLIHAAQYGHVAVVRVLLETGDNVDRANAYGHTALHYAAFHEHPDVCRLLLDWGAKVSSQDTGKNTPLHYAAEKGHLSAVKLLVERGADVRLKNDKGQTASDMARKDGHNSVADWLDSVSRG